MENSEQAPIAVESPDKKPVRKRSTFERIIVWGGILILLLVLLLEWSSQRSFAASMKKLETAIGANSSDNKFSTGIPRDEAVKLIEGFTFSSKVEGTVHSPQKYCYQWPSIFKFYKLALSIDGTDRAILVEAVLPEEHSK